jgi:hypothetical protein
MKRLALVMVALAGCGVHEVSSLEQGSLSDFKGFIGACKPKGGEDKLSFTDYWDYGCFCGRGGSGKPVDATDACCEAHDACWKRVRAAGNGSCYFENYSKAFVDKDGKTTDDCSQWHVGCACLPPHQPGNNKVIEQDCCKCDIEAVKCFQRAREQALAGKPGFYDPKWKNWSNNGEPKDCSATKGKSITCESGYLPKGVTQCDEGETVSRTTLLGNMRYWCRATCYKPQTCETNAARPKYFARCTDPPAEDQGACPDASHEAEYAGESDGDSCTGNHAACPESEYCGDGSACPDGQHCSGGCCETSPETSWGDLEV